MTRVLVIEDSLTIRTLVQLTLGREGYEVELAATGAEGVARARRTRPDLMLLDYMLPDMKGIDVCEQLHAAGNIDDVPIVLMSAKNQEVRPLFKDFANVVDYIGKPFTGVDLVERVRALVRARPLAPKAAAPVAPELERTESAARAIFGQLRERLAQVPLWLQQVQGPPAPFLARKLLTAEVVDGLLAALSPFFANRPAQSGEVLLEGHTTLMPVLGLLKVLSAYGRTGELTLEQGERRTIAYWTRGAIMLATTRDAASYTRGSAFNLAGVPQEARATAEDEQHRTGKPVFLSLAEAGVLPSGELPGLLHEQSKRVLLEAIDGGAGTFVWREQVDAPLYVDAYARPLTPTQLVLERLRQRPPSPTEQALATDTAFERADNFSRKLRQLELTTGERRVLSAVDGRTTVQGIVAKTGLPLSEVTVTLAVMTEAELVKRRGGSGRAAEPKSGRAVMVFEPDVENFVKPLVQLLSNRHEPLSVVELQAGADWTSEILKQRPRLVLVNAAADDAQLERTARSIRGTLEISDTQLVAVQDEPTPGRGELLTGMGFDVILQKPIAFGDIERLLAT